jgi:hypothetical protein
VLRITPDSGATKVRTKEVQFIFDEVVADRPTGAAADLDGIFLVSPRHGAAQVSWHRDRITVRPRNGFRDSTAYRITMLPGLADLRGNVRKETVSIVFSTGPSFPPYSIHGMTFDWAAQRPAPGTYIEAINQRDTTIVYVTASDTAGRFDVGPMPAGKYLVRGLIDKNANRALDRAEKWDTVTTTIARTSPTVELNAIERDTMPAVIDNIVVVDSVSLRVSFDKPISPALQLTPELVTLQRADSSKVQNTRVVWGVEFENTQRVADSTRRADSLRVKSRTDSIAHVDSLRAKGDTAALRAIRPAAPPAAPPQTPNPNRGPPPPPKPKKPAPDRAIVIIVPPSSAFPPSTEYRITVQNIPNLIGKSAPSSRRFNIPAPKPTPKDSAAKADTTRRPSAPSTRPPSLWR